LKVDLAPSILPFISRIHCLLHVSEKGSDVTFESHPQPRFTSKPPAKKHFHDDEIQIWIVDCKSKVGSFVQKHHNVRQLINAGIVERMETDIEQLQPFELFKVPPEGVVLQLASHANATYLIRPLQVAANPTMDIKTRDLVANLCSSCHIEFDIGPRLDFENIQTRSHLVADSFEQWNPIVWTALANGTSIVNMEWLQNVNALVDKPREERILLPLDAQFPLLPPPLDENLENLVIHCKASAQALLQHRLNRNKLLHRCVVMSTEPNDVLEKLVVLMGGSWCLLDDLTTNHVTTTNLKTQFKSAGILHDRFIWLAPRPAHFSSPVKKITTSTKVRQVDPFEIPMLLLESVPPSESSMALCDATRPSQVIEKSTDARLLEMGLQEDVSMTDVATFGDTQETRGTVNTQEDVPIRATTPRRVQLPVQDASPRHASKSPILKQVLTARPVKKEPRRFEEAIEDLFAPFVPLPPPPKSQSQKSKHAVPPVVNQEEPKFISRTNLPTDAERRQELHELDQLLDRPKTEDDLDPRGRITDGKKMSAKELAKFTSPRKRKRGDVVMEDYVTHVVAKAVGKEMHQDASWDDDEPDVAVPVLVTDSLYNSTYLGAVVPKKTKLVGRGTEGVNYKLFRKQKIPRRHNYLSLNGDVNGRLLQTAAIPLPPGDNDVDSEDEPLDNTPLIPRHTRVYNAKGKERQAAMAAFFASPQKSDRAVSNISHASRRESDARESDVPSSRVYISDDEDEGMAAYLKRR
jgi:hypothetical protein